MHSLIRIHPSVERALEARRPIVALESSVLAQGLPVPHNRRALERMVRGVEQCGATPAVTGLVRGAPSVGLEPEDLERFLARTGIRKVSARDIPFAVAAKLDGATTVAASIALAAAAGLEVFATGGIGGVHRDAPYDESADLAELARTPIVVVCAGAKSILDLEATWERLESLGIPVVGFQTDELPGFFTAETGIRLDMRVDSAREIAKIFRVQRALGWPQALLVVQPPPGGHRLAREEVDAAVASAQTEAGKAGIRGAALTPFLLAAVMRHTQGASLDANLALLEQNAALAGEIARELSAMPP